MTWAKSSEISLGPGGVGGGGGGGWGWGGGGGGGGGGFCRVISKKDRAVVGSYATEK